MATYLIINLIFMALVLVSFWVKPRLPGKSWWLAFAVLLVMTAIFDSLIVGFDIVAYDLDRILGIYIIKAPIEDFMYTILAMIMVPVIWRRLGRAQSN